MLNTFAEAKRAVFIEILVVDSGSADSTVGVAGPAVVFVLPSPGRAAQMNIEAQRAERDIFC